MAEAASTSKSPSSSEQQKSKIRFDDEEFAIRKRLPPQLPRRNIDVYVTNKTAFKAQYETCKKLLDKGEPEIFIHSLGAAIPKAVNLALQIEKSYSGSLTVNVHTATVELTDDFEGLRGDSQSESHSRHNSAVHIKLSRPAETPAKD